MAAVPAMRYWKFVCKKDTEAECFGRMLFGDTRSSWNEIRDVRRGDVLFLYNLETDILFGPFIADSDGQLNIEPDAWGSRFPAQVRVRAPAGIAVINNASTIFWVLKEEELQASRRRGKDDLRIHTSTQIKRQGA